DVARLELADPGRVSDGPIVGVALVEGPQDLEFAGPGVAVFADVEVEAEQFHVHPRLETRPPQPLQREDGGLGGIGTAEGEPLALQLAEPAQTLSPAGDPC